VVQGAEKERVVAYLRGADVLTVAPRWSHGSGSWGETALALPAGRWSNRLTGESFTGQVKIEELLRVFPVALLTRG
jgi:(1->4)-alpha-D-glucan 1-alpha-D-glucosylmutase